MKNPTGSILFLFASAGCMAILLSSSTGGGPTPSAQASPAQTVAPEALPPSISDPSPSPSPSRIPASLALPQATPAQSAQAPASPIPFSAQNKETAKAIYALLKDIQESEFDPEKNLGCITKLQDAIAQSDFTSVQIISGYIKDSLTLNTLRSKDIKTQRNDTGKMDREEGNKTSGSAGVGPLLNVSIGGGYEKTNSQKREDQNVTDVSISSQNDAVILDKARQQQAISYGLLLNEMKHLGFSRPVDIKKVYGRWKWRCNEDAATYEFDFRQDGTVYVKLNADNPAKWRGHGFVNKGRGAWKLDYRSLTLELNDVNLAGFWTQHPLIFFAGKEIVSIDDEKMLLATDEDNELKKISESSKK